MALTTPSEVIDALGGTTAVARLTNRSQQSVTNWRRNGRLPPTTFLILSHALRELDLEAELSLWSMEEPA